MTNHHQRRFQALARADRRLADLMYAYLGYHSQRSHGSFDVFDQRAEWRFLQQLYDGNSNAWRQLLDIWSPRLYQYLIYSTHHPTDAQCLLQSTFSKVAKLATVELVDSFSALTVLIVSTVYHAIEQYQAQQGVPTLDAFTMQAASNPGQERFLAALQQLAPSLRQLLLMRYLIGLSVNELAAITGYRSANITLILRAAALHFSQL